MARGIPSSVIHAFRRIPLFEAVSRRGIRSIVSSATEIDVPAGKPVVREGETDRYLYVITRGTALVTKGGRKLNELVPGDFFGELAFLTGAPRSATVTPYSDLRVMAIGPRELDVIVAKEPVIARRLLEAMAKRVQANDRSATA